MTTSPNLTNGRSVLCCVFLFMVYAQSFGQNLSDDTYGKGLTVQAKDSSFFVKFGFRFQTLYLGTTDLRTREYQEQMLIRRSRLKFEGFAYDPRVTYKVELALSNRDHSSGHEPEFSETASIVLDAVMKWKFSPGWELWFGQTKLPGNRERVISSQKLQFVDRSLVNSRFNLDRDVGVQLHHTSGSNVIFKQALAISLGEGRNITEDIPSSGRQVTGRVEILPMGEFTGKGDYFGSDLKREKTPKLSIGLTGDYNSQTVRQRGNLGRFLYNELTPEEGDYLYTNISTFMADMMFKYNGWSVASEYAKRDVADDDKGFGYGDGFVVQAGYLLPSNWEFAGRFTDINGGVNSPISDITEYTFGISHYIKGHNLKIQTDYSYQQRQGTFNRTIFRFQTELAF